MWQRAPGVEGRSHGAAYRDSARAVVLTLVLVVAVSSNSPSPCLRTDKNIRLLLLLQVFCSCEHTCSPSRLKELL